MGQEVQENARNLNLVKRERGGGQMGSGKLAESEGKNDITARKRFSAFVLSGLLHMKIENIITKIQFSFIAIYLF